MYLQLLAFLSPVIGILMAGSGIVSCPGHGLREATHPSMLYTLSLPVPRRRWLQIRTALGLMLTVGLIGLMVAVPPLIGPFWNHRFSWVWAIRAVPFLFLGSAVFHMFAVLLETLRGANWRVGSMAALFVCVAVQATLRNRINIFPFMAGLETSALGILVCLALSALLFWRAIVALDRRDF